MLVTHRVGLVDENSVRGVRVRGRVEVVFGQVGVAVQSTLHGRRAGPVDDESEDSDDAEGVEGEGTNYFLVNPREES